MPPLLQLVTDHGRLGVPGSAAAIEALVACVTGAARAGLDLVQVREPGLSDAALYDLVARLTASAEGRTRIVVNERTDVALAAGAAGVHLRAASVPASRVRRIAPPGFVIGRSVHTRAEVEAAVADGGADYLVLGSVFPSESKAAGHPVAGLGLLAEAAAVSPVPVLAIGGVTRARLPLIARAGAAGAAAIGWLMDAACGGTLTDELAAAREAFGARRGDLR